MNINSNVLEDINNENDNAFDPSIVQSSSNSPESKTSEPVTLTVKTDDVRQQETELSDKDLELLAESSVKFDVVSDKAEKVEELEAVKSNILANEAISKSDAIDINLAFESIQSSPPPLNLPEYTNVPSKTNYNFALRLVSNQSEKLKSDVLESFREFVHVSLADIALLIARIGEFYLPSLKQTSSYSKTQLMEYLDKFETNNDTWFIKGKEAVDVSKSELSHFSKGGETLSIAETDVDKQWSFSEMSSDSKEYTDEVACELDTFLKNIAEVMKCPKTRKYISFVINKDADNVVDILSYRPNGLSENDEIFTLNHLAALVKSAEVTDYLDIAYSSVSSSLTWLKDDIDKNGECGYTLVKDYSASIKDMLKSAKVLCSLIMSVNILLANSFAFFVRLKSI